MMKMVEKNMTETIMILEQLISILSLYSDGFIWLQINPLKKYLLKTVEKCSTLGFKFQKHHLIP